MFELYRDDRQGAKGSKRKPVRLLLEELEGRCLLSSGLSPTGSIALGADGHIWFPESDPRTPYFPTLDLPPNRIGELDPSTGVVQEFSVPLLEWNPAIVSAPDGSILFDQATEIDQLDPQTGQVKQFQLSPGTYAFNEFITGSDNGFWFPEQNFPYGGYRVGWIDPATGTYQEFVLPGQVSWYFEATANSDGTFWFSEGHNLAPPFSAIMAIPDGYIGSFNPTTGDFKEYHTGFEPRGLTWGNDGNLWFIGSDFRQPGILPWYSAHEIIYRVDPRTSDMVHFDLPSGMHAISVMALNKKDGSLWFLMGNYNTGQLSVGEIDPTTGNIDSFNLNTQDPMSRSIIVGAGGTIWFPQEHGIGEFSPSTGAYQEFVGQGQKVVPPGGPPMPGDSTSPPDVSNNFISATSTTLSTIAGNNLDAILPGSDWETAIATFTPQTLIPSTGAGYQATVDWGDGATTSLVLTVTENATYDITAGHTYQSAGTYCIKVTIGNYDPANPLGDNAVTVFSTANVNDPFNINM